MLSPMERPDPAVEALTARMAAEHQRATLPGLSDERLQVVEARLAREADGNAAAKARHVVVVEELHRRGVG